MTSCNGIDVRNTTPAHAKQFFDMWHPLGAGGGLKGGKEYLYGYEDGTAMFMAAFVYPRAIWKTRKVVLELSRMAWSPSAKHSASTFLRKCVRILRRRYQGYVVTYALPGTDGIVYRRAGFFQDGYSSGWSWASRTDQNFQRPKTVGDKQNLKRFFVELKCLNQTQPHKQP